METLLLITIAALVHAVIVGSLEPYFSRQLALRCSNCSTGDKYYQNRYDSYGYKKGQDLREPGDGHNGLFLAFFWPLALPYMVANYKRNPRLQLANDRIDAYWDRVRAEDQRNRIAELEADTLKQIN